MDDVDMAYEDYGEESDDSDDLDIKELENQAKQGDFKNENDNQDAMINDEIEDFDSDEDNMMPL